MVRGDFFHESTPEPSTATAFFCSTPYQAILAVTSVTRLGSDAKAYIRVLNHFRSAEEVVSKLAKSGLFRRSVLVDGWGPLGNLAKSRPKVFRRCPLLRRLQYALCLQDYRRIAQRYISFDNFRYSDAYLLFPDLLIQVATKLLFARSRHLKVHLSEDGAGGHAAQISRATRKKRLFNLVTGYGVIVDSYIELLVFRPELVYERRSLPFMGRSPLAGRGVVIRALREVFEYRSAAPLTERFISFERPLNFVPGFDAKIVELALGKLPHEDTLVKLHPRTARLECGDLPVCDYTTVPWDIVFANMSKTEKVLAICSSTAATTAKIIRKEEPVFMFLSDALEPALDNAGAKGFREVFGRFGLSYLDPWRVFAPGSAAELHRIVECIDCPTHSASQIGL